MSDVSDADVITWRYVVCD